MSTYKQTLQTQILQAIDNLYVADFIVDEIKDIFKHLNIYRLENIIANSELFTDYVKEIDAINTSMYTKNPVQQKRKRATQRKLNDDLAYYISTSGRKRLSINEQKKFQKISTEELVQKSTLIKGRFLLSLSDFAQWSMCRLQNKYLYNTDNIRRTTNSKTPKH